MSLSDIATVPRVLLASLAVAGCAASPEPAPAEPAAAPAGAESIEIAELERAFWYCDYMATTHGVLATPMAACNFATIELRRKKFSGSFRALMAWWEENKAAEHGKLRRKAPAAGPYLRDQ
jgi:hypothetical protein